MENTELLQHNKDAWETFALQQCEKVNELKILCKRYKTALEVLANYDENVEDYYGGVSINYSKMCHDMIDYAKAMINNIDKGVKNNGCD